MKQIALLLCVVSLAACSPTATATPVPAATAVPTATATVTAEPTATTAPTDTPAPTDTATTEPAAPPSAAGDTSPPAGAADQVASGASSQGRGKPLAVEFTDPHYECWQQCLGSVDVWGYRSLQVLMKVANRADDRTLPGRPVERADDNTVGWQPSRWIVTDGSSEWTIDSNFEWTRSEGEFWTIPDVPPGGSAEFTFLAFPVPYGAWVKAVEYEDPWGNLYRQDFPKPEPGQLNYVDCGEPREGKC